ncbi:MAG TPA: hypothetical protein VD993_10045 [Chitinophagaceae bacterium]|nr:hypothetical protein [Chitinophagaceae bacterium]
MIKRIFFLVPCSLFLVQLFAQDPKKKTIDITSTFKPVLREAVKINFNAVPPVADTTRPRLSYNIPTQNLLFAYQPADLKPVALHVDSLTAWEYSNYIKAGIGNVHQPFIQAGFSFGNSENSYFNVFANHYTSKGDLNQFQKNSLTSVDLTGTVRTIKNHEWNGKLGVKSEDYYFYGFRPGTLNFSKEQLRQRFQTYEGKVHFRNYAPTEFDLLYNPNLSVSVFANNMNPRGQETNSVLELPLEKRFSEFGFKIGLTADLTGFNRGGDKNAKTINNNIYLVKPTLVFKTPNVYVHGGIIPSWDQGEFNLMPNVMVEFKVPEQPFTVQLGWIGYYNKGSYQRFAGINPWILQPDSLLNTRVQERYVGIKGSAGNHLTYSAKLGFNLYKNMALFVNDTVDGKTFLTLYEPSMQALHLHAEIGYTQGEAFSASAKLDFNQYNKLQREKKAWGLLPFEFTGSLKWRLLKDLWLRSDIFAWDGAQYRGKNLDNYKGEAAFDWSAGVEFRITRQFNLWVQMNNIFNNKYERWNQYEAYGFNILGGIVYSFGQRR